ncbi:MULTISPECIES: alpha/beta hydrolase-fold protein [unclassified Meiothermus]|uniref:carboxylesterase family protein n=1 Tax=unclassified Meiothermus TaxID=370471 RepID=UPI000D7BE0DB|nr:MULTISPECIES: alpha/beta hydrolase-fold protein [unclassified Meiothermus]PZA08402.1 phospholipase [Meiothermus sp. Pnk-1]RYM37069.1 phospholipase [Meiothermus sp. PNK-Is4]
MSVRFRYRKAAFDTLPYALYVPDGPPPKEGWPLVVFLHGSGERGCDGKKQTTVGLGPAIRENPEDWPALVLMPQCPQGLLWQGTVLEAVYALLCELERKAQIDSRRIYLTGLSMGGHGAWNMAIRYPDKFAALAPICGAADPFAVMSRLGHLPVWNFHGDADTVVPVEFSRVLQRALERAGNKNHRFTEYAGVEHNSWDRAYREREFIRWLFSQTRGSGPPLGRM